jgi:DNA-damage-inducible protein J
MLKQEKTVTISLKVPLMMKRTFDAQCSSIGFTQSAVLRSFIHYVTTRGQLPKEMTDPDPFYSEENQEWLRKSLQDYKDGKGVTMTMDEVDAMFEKLLGEKLR